MACFEDWLRDGQDTQDIKEDKQILKCIQSFFEEHGESRLQDLNSPSKAITSMVGYKDENFYYIRPQSFKKILCKDFDEKKVLEVLKKKGILKCQRNRLTFLKKIRGKTLRFYSFIRDKIYHFE